MARSPAASNFTLSSHEDQSTQAQAETIMPYRASLTVDHLLTQRKCSTWIPIEPCLGAESEKCVTIVRSTIQLPDPTSKQGRSGRLWWDLRLLTQQQSWIILDAAFLCSIGINRLWAISKSLKLFSKPNLVISPDNIGTFHERTQTANSNIRKSSRGVF